MHKILDNKNLKKVSGGLNLNLDVAGDAGIYTVHENAKSTDNFNIELNGEVDGNLQAVEGANVSDTDLDGEYLGQGHLNNANSTYGDKNVYNKLLRREE